MGLSENLSLFWKEFTLANPWLASKDVFVRGHTLFAPLWLKKLPDLIHFDFVGPEKHLTSMVEERVSFALTESGLLFGLVKKNSIFVLISILVWMRIYPEWMIRLFYRKESVIPFA